MYPQDSIAALASAWGESAIAVIRVSGRDSLQRLAGLFRTRAGAGQGAAAGSGRLAETPGHTLRHGLLVDAEREEPVDEVVVAVYRGPRSYTGEDGAEVFCHGSPAVIKKILELLRRAGFRHADPGEFTLRAFLNGKMRLTQAEAVNEIVRARTDRARALALSRLSGAIEQRISRVKQGLLETLAALEVRLDYPEEEQPDPVVSREAVTGWLKELRRLADSYRTGSIIQEGIAVVLAGRTNVGKSTLFNLLLKEDRAMVSEIHGTTRDYLEGSLALGDIPVRLYDTAGYRNRAGELGREGIRRTDRIVRGAGLVLYLVDAATGVTALDEEFFAGFEAPERLIRVWNKVDLNPGPPPRGFLPLSARSGEGLAELVREIAERALGRGALDAQEPLIDSLRQKELLERACRALEGFHRGSGEGLPLDVLAVDLKEAMDALGEITGEVTSQDLLAAVFSRFCVGK